MLNDQFDANIMTKVSSLFHLSASVALFAVLIKARDQKVFSEDIEDVDLFLCKQQVNFSSFLSLIVIIVNHSINFKQQVSTIKPKCIE
jgi:hypothetical protein